MTSIEDAIDESNEAAAIRGIVAPWVQDRMMSNLQQLIALYRGGQTEHDTILGKVAEITALNDLLNHLDTIRRRADNAVERELRHAETN